MKKLVLILTITIFCLVLMACSPVCSSAGVSNLICAVDPPQFYYGDYVDKSQIVSVELIFYTNCENSEETLNYHVENEMQIAKLDKETIQKFLAETDTWYIFGSSKHPVNVSAKCVKISFSSGDFDIISQNTLAMRYNSSGQVVEYIGTVAKHYIASSMARFFHK